MKPLFDLCIFDWDGTMMCTTGAIIDSIRFTSGLQGYSVPDEATVRGAIGLGREDTMKTLVPECPRELWPRYEATYRERYIALENEIPLVTGMRELLDDLKENGVRIAIATGKSDRGLNRVLTAHNLMGLFDATRTGAVRNPKPAPEMILEILSELHIEKDRAVMIGDSTLDLKMAQNASIAAIGVTYGACYREELATLPNFGIVDNVAELKNLLFS